MNSFTKTLLQSDALTQAACLARGEISSEALTRAALVASVRVNSAINCFVHLDPNSALEAARAADQRRRLGRPLSLFDGLTFAAKDNIDLAGMPTGNGLGYRGDAPIAREDAPAVAALKRAGMVPLGKLNMHEIALGATNDNPHCGRCHNPLRPGFTPGGSSGGSAAAVAAGLCAIALGTDTMGSVRIPASYCGVYGLKPGLGTVSTAGVTRLCRRLDSVGPLARSGRDLQALWPILGGESAASAEGTPVIEEPELDLAKLRWALMRDSTRLGVDAEIAHAYARLLDGLPGAARLLRDFSAVDFSAARRAGLLLCEAEANVQFAEQLQQRPELFSEGLRKLLRWGAERSAPDLVRAQDMVEATGDWLRRQLQGADFLLTPTAPQAAFSFDAQAPASQANLTSCVNMAGLAAASIPLGVNAAGLPFGLQVIGRAGAEAQLLAVCTALQVRCVSNNTRLLAEGG